LSTNWAKFQGKQSVNLALTVIEIVTPVFLLAAVGLIWVRAGFDYPTEFISRLVMKVSIPALIFVALATSDITPTALSTVALASVTGYLALLAIAFVSLRLFGLDFRSLTAPLVFGNTGNLGLPLALFAFDNQGFDYALVVFAVSGILSFTLGIWITSGRTSFRLLFQEPLVPATVLGAVFLWFGWGIPELASRTLYLAGEMSIPLMLITLGVAIARLTPGLLSQALWLSLARVIVCIAVAWGIGRLWGLDPIAFGVFVLQLSTPVAVTTYLIATRFDVDSQSVASLVLISTALSLITLPLTLAVLL